jgi:hypothetical protein
LQMVLGSIFLFSVDSLIYLLDSAEV